MNQDKLGFLSTYKDFGADFESYTVRRIDFESTFHFQSFLVQTSHCQHANAITTPEEGLILILLFMLVEIDRRETAVALDQQQQQQNGQTSSNRKSKKSNVGGFNRGSQNN